MKDTVIICVLNDLALESDDEGRPVLPENISYYASDLQEAFYGIQANEAPVKYLLRAADKNKRDISEIVYLCPKECLKKHIPSAPPRADDAAVADETETAERPAETLLSAEDLFAKNIAGFCSASNIPMPVLNPLAYNPARPADSLIELISYLDGSYDISLDLTADHLDAVALLMLADQILKTQSPASSIGTTVYADAESRTLIKQDSAFDLADLVYAMQAFLEHGQADLLNSFFAASGFTFPEIAVLCACAADFSKALLLCRVDDLEKKVAAVHKALDDVEAALGAESRRHRLLSDILAALSDPESWSYDTPLDEALQAVAQSNLHIDLDPAQLESNLEAARQNYAVIQKELAFYDLIPTFRSGFVQPAETNDELILNTIKWCAERQMVWQALRLFRDRVSEIVFHQGYFDVTDSFTQLEKEQQDALISELCIHVFIHYRKKEGQSSLYFYSKHREENYSQYFTLNPDKYEQLHMIIVWYKYLHGIYNATILRKTERRMNRAYAFACIFLDKAIDDPASVNELQQSILQAVACVEHPVFANTGWWNSAFWQAAAAVNGHDVKSGEAHSRSDTRPPGNQASDNKLSGTGRRSNNVQSIAELLNYLDEYAEGADEVPFLDFKFWCDQAKKKQLNKGQLGLSGSMPFYAGLCRKYGSKFSYHKVDDVVYLRFR